MKQIKQETETWIKTVIVHYNICPFARKVMEEQTVHYCVDQSSKMEKNLHILLDEVLRLDSDDSIETIFLIYSRNFADFDDFLTYLEIANELLALQGYEGVYQLASFHPNYCFAGVEETDAANYTNRSPYPMLHLIREESIDDVLKSYPYPENIPLRNIKLTRELGETKMQTLLAACKKEF